MTLRACVHSLRAMKNRTQSTTPDQDRLARRERGRLLVRNATRGAIVGGIALTAVFAGIAYHATHTKTTAGAVSVTQASGGSQGSAGAQSTATPIVASGGS